MKKVIILLVSVLFITIIGCNKDDENANAKFSVKQKTTALKSVKGGTFTFSKVLVGISEIDFEMEIGTEDLDYEFEGPFQYDVLAGTSSPVIPTIEIIPGSYHELEFDIDDVLPNGNSIEISGTYDDGNLYQFEFTSTFEADFDIQNVAGIKASIDQTVNFILYLDLVSLFNGVNFSTAIVDNDNILRINSSSNSNLASIIENNLDDIMDFDND